MKMQTVLITGASSGIGKALAEVYARPGNQLILWGRNQERLEEVAKNCRTRGSPVESDSFDISDLDALEQKLVASDAQLPIDLAIFNAGIGGSLSRDCLTQSPEATRNMIAVNLAAPLVGANLLAARMARRRNGHIVFVGSIAGNFPLPMAPAYSATKAGVALFAEALRLRLERYGVRVTLVAPGFVDTPMSQALNEPTPFLISSDTAAGIIAKAIDRGAGEIVLPWQFAVLLRAASFMPRSIIRAVLARV